jgi:hypothetical protein
VLASWPPPRAMFVSPTECRTAARGIINDLYNILVLKNVHFRLPALAAPFAVGHGCHCFQRVDLGWEVKKWVLIQPEKSLDAALRK